MSWKTWFSWFKVGGKYLLIERALTVPTRLIDGLMIFFIWTDPHYGVLKAFLICTPLNFALCSLVVFTNDLLAKRGKDMTGIDEMRKDAEEKGGFRRWVLRRRVAIFWIGSWFYLDPDYVTLFLRDKGATFWENGYRITLPSTLVAMIVWTAIYWSAHEGYAWASRFVEFF
ncbi:MAG: hypothetical protein RLY47_131 [Candidatus Parcubacteria bacterium]|jgi:hypothetical protein